MAYKIRYNSPTDRGYLVSAILLGLFISPTDALPRENPRLLTREPKGGAGGGSGITGDEESAIPSFIHNTGALIGIAIGCFVTVILASIGIFYWRRHRSKREQQQREVESRQSQQLMISNSPNRLSSDIYVPPGQYHHYPDNVRLVVEGDNNGYPEMRQGPVQDRRWAGTQYNRSYLHP